MAQDVVVGIDLGTTVLKVGAFGTEDGRLVGQADCRLPVRHLPGGGRELSAAAIDKAFRRVIGEVKQQAGSRWRRVCGVGLAAQGGSSLIVDRTTGQPRTDMVLWNDARAHLWVTRLRGQVETRFWRRFFLFDMPPTGLGRLAWLKERRPELFRDEYIHIGAGEYVFHRLTGVWRQDAGNAIQVGSYNARARKLDGAAFELVGVPLSFVAPLRKAHETSPLSREGARALGVAEGIPVAGPYIDQEACYMSALGATARPLQCSLGTAWVGNFELPEAVQGRSPSQLALPAPTGVGTLIVQPLYTGNTAWDWALAAFLDRDLAKALKQAAAVFAQRILPPDGLVSIPWCTQQNPFSPEAYGAGLFLGVSTQTTAADLLRATAAGLVFELRRVFADLKKLGVIDGVVLGGGASKAAYFRQLVARVFEPAPTLWQEDYEVAAARGAVLALSPRAARGNVSRVRAASIKAEEVNRAYGLYTTMFERVLGHITDAGPFRCRARSR
jgi:sugar (pentulose or hexulose) kinase